jgi:hypothetical protein
MIVTKTRESKLRDFRLLNPRSFEEYMTYIFMEEVPEDAGDKETIDEKCWEWIATLDPVEMMELVEKYEAKTF